MRAGTIYSLFTALCLAGLIAGCKPKEQVASTTTVQKDNPKTKKGLSEKDRVQFQSTFYDACKEKIKGNMEVAENLFKDCLKIDSSSAPVQYELASLYRFTGLNDEALKYAKKASAKDPKNEWYQLLYIECLHNKRQYSDAAQAYEKLVKYVPGKPDYYIALADEYVYAKKPEKAAKVYEEYEKTFGKDESVSLKRVAVLREQNKLAEAEAVLKELIRDFPGEPRYFTYLAEIYQDKGEPEKAFSIYQESLKNDPNNPYIHLALADYYRQQKKDSLFFSEVKIAFTSPDMDIDNKVRILLSYYDMTETFPKYLGEAYELLDILTKTHPAEAKAWSVDGDFLYRDKRYKEAKAAYEQVLETDKGKFPVWRSLLFCDAELNDMAALKKHSEEAMDLFPNQPVTYYFNGLANQRLKNYKTAIQSYLDGQEFVFDDIPLQTQFLSNLGESYNADKQYEKSDKAFEDALLLAPNDVGIMNNYAYYLSLRKTKLDRAEKLSARSLEIDAGSISYMDTYAWILYQQGKYENAKTWLDKALSKGADNRPAILEHYGDVLYKLNDKTKALEYWKKAKEKGGNSELLNKKIADGKLYE
jgi:tetratricopeptide (TPR) repeat protein